MYSNVFNLKAKFIVPAGNPC